MADLSKLCSTSRLIMTKEIMVKFHEAHCFINNHPAFLDPMSDPISHMWVSKIDSKGNYIEDFFAFPKVLFHLAKLGQKVLFCQKYL